MQWQVRLLQASWSYQLYTSSLATPTTCYHQSAMEKPWNDATLLRRSIDTAPGATQRSSQHKLIQCCPGSHSSGWSGVNNWDNLWNTGHLLPLVSSSCVLTWPRVANNVWNLSQTIFLNVTIDWSFMALISSALFVWCILVESKNMDLG